MLKEYSPGAVTTDLAVSVSGFRMDYGDRPVIDSVTFDVRCGETFGGMRVRPLLPLAGPVKARNRILGSRACPTRIRPSPGRKHTPPRTRRKDSS